MIYFIFFIAVSLVLVLGFTIAPLTVIDKPLKIESLKTLINKNLIDNHVYYQDPFILRDYDSVIEDKNSFNPKVLDYIIPGNPKIAVHMVYGNKEDSYNNFQLYKSKQTRGTGNHLLFSYKKNLICADNEKCGFLVYEQVLPKVFKNVE